MNTHRTSNLEEALDAALVGQDRPDPADDARATADDLVSLVALASGLARLPKAPGPSADFTRALAARLAGSPAAAACDPAAADALDRALGDTNASAAPAELAELLTLAQGLRRLPAVPAPDAAFKAALASRLSAHLAGHTDSAAAAPFAQPTQDLLSALDQSLDALAAGGQDPRAVLLAACAQDTRAAGELEPLLHLAASLRALPSAPGPVAAFRTQLAKVLHQAPWPRSLPLPTAVAPWSWLGSLWRSTAAMAAAAATVLLFLGRAHLPLLAPVVPAAETAPPAFHEGPRSAASLPPIVRFGDRSARPQRPDGWSRDTLAPIAAAEPPKAVARLGVEPPAAPDPALIAAAAPMAVQVLALAPVPEAASAATEADDDRDREQERDRRDAERPAPAAAPTEAPLVLPTEPAPTGPVPTEPPGPQPTTAPPPTVPVIPANEPPRILDLTCTPDQVEEAGSAECRVEVADDGDLQDLDYEWILQGVGPELSDPRSPTVTFTASGNGGGLGWLGEFVLVIVVRDGEGLETRGRTQVTIKPAQP